jgi:hypothetical protein
LIIDDDVNKEFLHAYGMYTYIVRNYPRCDYKNKVYCVRLKENLEVIKEARRIDLEFCYVEKNYFDDYFHVAYSEYKKRQMVQKILNGKKFT